MAAGPLFTRELLTTARQPRHYLLRAGYVLLVFAVLYTAGQVIFGWQEVRMAGDSARFGHYVFNVVAVLQLTLVMGVALLASASTVSQEKDRRTLVLLLMTDLSGRELVLGKMFAALINVVTVILVSAAALMFVRLLGGVTVGQVIALELLCLSAGLMTAAWATLVAYWREKTFQTLAVSTLGLVVLLAVTAGLSVVLLDPAAELASWLNPYATLARVLNPLAYGDGLSAGLLAGGLAAPAVLGVLLLLIAVAKVRVWNPPRVVHQQAAEGEQARVRPARSVWGRPILWREIRTRAYGRKTAVVKAVYLLLAAALFYVGLTSTSGAVFGVLPPLGVSLVVLTLVSLLLLNAQAVTSLSTERDGQTLELLLVTEVPASEFIHGKFFGALWNAKEMIAAPLVLILAGYLTGRIGGPSGLENTIFLIVGYISLVAFSAMLGLHFGLTYGSSRRSIGTSLGTMTFLFLGIFVCMLLIVEGRSSFALQFTPFLVFILGGAIALWSVLTARSPSPALTFAALVLPFLTFYALVSFLLGNTLGVTLAVFFAYGFTALAMYIPSVSEYIVTLSRGGPGSSD